MDTQRLILFVIFSFSALFLWEAWQRENRPPPPPVASAPAGATKAATDLPAVPAATPPASAPAAGVPRRPAVPGAAPAVEVVPGASQITVTTDLYRAVVDTQGGAITEVALTAASRPGRQVEALPGDPEVAGAHAASRRAGCSATGLPNHRTVYEPLPGPHELAADAGQARTAAAGERAQRRQGRADADLQPRQLRDRCRLRRHQRGQRADRAVRVLPVHPRHQGDWACRARSPRSRTPGRSSTTMPTSSRRSSSARSTSSPPTRRASSRTPRTPTTAGWRWSSSYFVTAWLPSDEKKTAARVLHAQARRRPLRRRRHRARAGDRARRHRPCRRPALCRAAGPGPARQARHRPRPRRRLRDLHRAGRAAVLAAEVAVRNHRQLGLGDHRA